MINNIKKIYQSKTYIVLEFFLIFIIPVTLFLLIPSLYDYRSFFLLFGIVYIILVMFMQKHLLIDMGLTKKNFLRSLRDLVIPGILGLLIIYFAFKIFPSVCVTNLFRKDTNILPSVTRMFLYLLISIPIQEIIYRSYLALRLEKVISNRWLIIGISGFVFMFGHIPFNNWLLDIGTFLGGAWFMYNYLKYRNVYTMFIAHAVVGGVLIWQVLCIIGR